jgi:uncharacterized protein YdiU (UPF0061 family)
MKTFEICETACGGYESGNPCDYGPCPFLHEYKEKNEICNGYKYVGAVFNFEKPNH